MRFDERLIELGISLPSPSSPGGSYVPALQVGNLVFLSGQLPQWNGERRFLGRLGEDLDIEAGQQAARLCALNLIAHLRTMLNGSLDRVARCVRLAGYVNSTSSFTQQPQVLNGASDLMYQLFGDAGRHTRVAVGVSSLPSGGAVEIEAIFEVHQ